MSERVFVVQAYRWGAHRNHHYLVGVFTKKHPALQAARLEKELRGGKYLCEVIELELNTHEPALNWKLVLSQSEDQPDE